jgi:hypothetical protein
VVALIDNSILFFLLKQYLVTFNWKNNKNYLFLISELFWDITQRLVAVLYNRFGTTYRVPSFFFLDFLILEDVTDGLSRNVKTELQLKAAKYHRRAPEEA